MKKLFFLSFFIVQCICVHLSAQKPPIKFGKIPNADLLMDRCESDTTAAAVILCDYGVFDPDEFLFRRHLRIKILKKAGFGYADLTIDAKPLWMKGITFNLSQGEVEKSKLEKESIFYERVTDNYYITKITMPDVKEGSVLDISYAIRDIPFLWKFQDEVPVRWSEIRIESSDFFTINKNFTGQQYLTEQSDWRWVARDMPAIVEEPYIGSINNYTTKLEMEIANFNVTNQYSFAFKSFADSWNSVNSFIMENDDYDMQLATSLFLNDEKRKIDALNCDGNEKLIAAYELIKSQIRWNEKVRLFASQNLNAAFRDRSGNSAEVNLILCKFLQRLGFDAFPIVLSTRENGVLIHHFPTWRKLNYVIVGVKTEEQTLLLDATDEYLPAGMLPVRCLNHLGRSVLYEKSDWVVIEPQQKYVKTVLSSLKLSSDGFLEGSLDVKYSDYAAYEFRKTYHRYNSSEEYVEQMQTENVGLNIQSFETTNIDDIYQPVTCKMNVRIDKQNELIGDIMYINPMLTEKLEENPFKLEQRKYPVNIPYGSSRRYIVQIEVPEGFYVEKIPESLRTSLPENGGTFTYQIQQMNNTIQLIYSYQLNKTFYVPTDYNLLKAFYKSLYEKHNDVIVLKRKTDMVMR